MTRHLPDLYRPPDLPFLAAALLMLLLCFKGGGFGFIGNSPFFLPWPGEPLLIPSGGFILLFALTWAVGLILMLLIPPYLSVRQRALLILSLALLCRLFLIPHEASDDLNRYLWEGRLISEGISPYHHAPDDPALTALAQNDPFHARINHPGMPAAYPPFILYLFSLMVRLSYTPLSMKLLAICFDMGTLYLLLRLLRHRSLAPNWAALYAFNPVILYSFAGQGHFDAVQNFFLMAALCLYDRRQWGRMFLAAGLAVQSKYVAVLAIPFLIRRENWRYVWIMVLTITLPYLPFMTQNPAQLFGSLIRFGSEYAFNGSVHGLLRVIFGVIAPATAICKFLLMASLIFGYIWFHPRNPRFRDEPVSGCFFALGALLLLSPTVHFWYLSWLIPFLALRPFASWTLLCLTLGGYFVTNGILHHTGRWHLPVGWQVAEWLPFWLLFGRDIYLFCRQARAPVAEKPPESVSVIIPVRNEAGRIAACMDAVRRDRAVTEVIVVDGGSADRTAEIARKAGGQVIRHAAPSTDGGGRGGQICAGLMAARGDVVAVVHADTRITAPAFQGILDLLARQPTIVGGAVGGTFEGPGWRLRLLEFANNIRAVWMGISFGDQVQFFRRKPVVRNGTFPDIPLMEDVELSLRLQRLGRQTFLFGGATISARRWQSNVSWRTVMILRLFTVYLWQRLWKKPDTPEMYRQYYDKGQ